MPFAFTITRYSHTIFVLGVNLRSYEVALSASCVRDLLPARHPTTFELAVHPTTGQPLDVDAAALSMSVAPSAANLVLLGTDMDHGAIPAYLPMVSAGMETISDPARFLGFVQPMPDQDHFAAMLQTGTGDFHLGALGLVTNESAVGGVGEFVPGAPYILYGARQDASFTCTASASVETSVAMGSFVPESSGSDTVRDVYLVVNDTVSTPSGQRKGIKLYTKTAALLNTGANVTAGQSPQNVGEVWIDSDGNPAAVGTPVNARGFNAFTNSPDAPGCFGLIVESYDPANPSAAGTILGQIQCTRDGTCDLNTDGSAKLYTEGTQVSGDLSYDFSSIAASIASTVDTEGEMVEAFKVDFTEAGADALPSSLTQMTFSCSPWTRPT